MWNGLTFCCFWYCITSFMGTGVTHFNPGFKIITSLPFNSLLGRKLSINSFHLLLYIELITSYLFSDGRKRTVNFGNQRLGRHLAAEYTIIKSRTLKVTGNHDMYDRGAWFLRVIMSSSRALCCLPSVKKQKHDFQVCFVDRAGHPKNSWRQGHTKHKKVDEMAKELFADYVKEKNWANLRKRKSWHKLWKHTFYVEARKKEFVQCIIKQLLDSLFVISRIIK